VTFAKARDFPLLQSHEAHLKNVEVMVFHRGDRHLSVVRPRVVVGVHDETISRCLGQQRQQAQAPVDILRLGSGTARARARLKLVIVYRYHPHRIINYKFLPLRHIHFPRILTTDPKRMFLRIPGNCHVKIALKIKYFMQSMPIWAP
jgi:hypothetical protein